MRPVPVPSTPFTELVGCSVPIQQAAFGPPSPELAAAVTAAGGLGMLGAPMQPTERVAELVDAVAARTGGPVGVNFIGAFFDVDRDGECLDLAARRARVVEFFYGDPDAAVVERIHAGGALASWQAGSVEEAVAAAAAGCDLVVVQGQEAGGHVRGTVALLPLLAETLDRVEIPVVAAGGISHPRAMAAVLAAGAAGVRLGTRLVASRESPFHPEYLAALVEARGEEAVYTDRFSELWPDAPHRVLQGALDAAQRRGPGPVGRMQLGAERDVEIPTWAGIAPTADATGDVAAMAMFAGQGVGAITSIEPAGEIVRRFAAEAAAVLASATRGEPG